MDDSYIVESLPSHARHSGGKTLLVHIYPTPDISTYSVEWYHLGGPQQGHHKPYQYQSIIEYSTECGPLCTLCLAHMQYHMEYGCLGGPQLFGRSELEPNQHTTEPRETSTWPAATGPLPLGNACFPDMTHGLGIMLYINQHIFVPARQQHTRFDLCSQLVLAGQGIHQWPTLLPGGVMPIMGHTKVYLLILSYVVLADLYFTMNGSHHVMCGPLKGSYWD